jgi:hypothetical protein
MASIRIHGGDFNEGRGSLATGFLTLPRQGSFLGETVPLSAITSVTVATQENKKKLLRMVGGGVAGAVLLGPIGAIGGMLLSGNKASITFVAQINDGRSFVATADAATFAKLQAAAVKSGSDSGRISTAGRDSTPTPAHTLEQRLTELSVHEQVARTFSEAGWALSQPKKRAGARYSVIHASNVSREVAIAFTEDVLGRYNISMMANAMRDSYPVAHLVTIGSSVARDAVSAARDYEVALGINDDVLTVVNDAIAGTLAIAQIKAHWSNF